MLPITSAMRVYLCLSPVDFRCGFDDLTRLVENTLHARPSEGGLFLFTNRRGDQMRALCCDRNGTVLLSKRLTSATFAWPRSLQPLSASIEISLSQFTALFAGLSMPSGITDRALPQRSATI